MILTVPLEVGGNSLLGFVLLIIGLMFLGGVFISFVITQIVKAIYEARNENKFTKKQYWLTMTLCLLLCAIISGMICF